MNDKKQQKSLFYSVKHKVECHGGIRPFAKKLQVNPGIIWNVLNGGDSPILRRKMGIPKHPPRSRLCIDCDADTIAAFDAGRGELTRCEYLKELLR